MELNSGGNAFDWFFLAMIHSRLGDQIRAREWYVRASDWMEDERSEDKELLRFREEADRLMGEEEPAVPNDAGEQTDEPQAEKGTNATN